MSSLHVICRVGESEYAIAADDVFQLESFVGATPVPGAPKYVRGVVEIRQHMVPVVDCRARFGLPPAPATAESRVIVLKHGERYVGLLADSARDIENISCQQIQEMPDLILHKTAGFIKSVVKIKDRFVMLLDTSKVIEGSNSDA